MDEHGQASAAAGLAEASASMSGPMQQLQLQQHAAQQQALRTAAFWQSRSQEISMIDPEQKDWNQPELPLARIKKIMKSEDEIRSEFGGAKFNISAEAPVMFAKACEIFVLELTMQAWNYTEEGKRRTLQRGDIVNAVSKNDTYDFLIDIVPREAPKPSKQKEPDVDELNRAAMMDPSSPYLVMQKQQEEAAQQMMAQAQQQAQDQQAAAGMDPQQMALYQQQLMWYQHMMQQQQQYYQQLGEQQDQQGGGGIPDFAGMLASAQQQEEEQQQSMSAAEQQQAQTAAYAATASLMADAAGGGMINADGADGSGMAVPDSVPAPDGVEAPLGTLERSTAGL